MNIFISNDTLGILSVALGLLGYVFYIRGILQGKVKPHTFTWAVWGLLTAIAFFAQVSANGGAGAWVTGITALCSFGFALVGLGNSSRKFITKSDWIFFLCALLTIPIWYITGNPLWSVVIITVVDFAAFVPTVRKAFSNPRTENAWTYALSGLKFAVSLLALNAFSITTALYPASLVLANVAFAGMLIWRRNKK